MLGPYVNISCNLSIQGSLFPKVKKKANTEELINAVFSHSVILNVMVSVVRM